MACTMPGFPDKYMPFMDEDPMGGVSSQRRAGSPTARSCAGAASATIKRKYDKEPEWRHNRAELTTGYAKRW